MSRYIALLRAVNVGGNNIIKMEDLRQLLEKAGFADVKTYIQSGNALFDSKESASTLKTRLEARLEDFMGKKITVILRTQAEMKKVVEQDPFAEEMATEKYKYYVNFLESPLDKPAAEKLLALNNDYELYHVNGAEVYSLVAREAPVKLMYSTNFLEKTLKIPTTARNWNVVNKLAEM